MAGAALAMSAAVIGASCGGGGDTAGATEGSGGFLGGGGSESNSTSDHMSMSNGTGGGFVGTGTSSQHTSSGTSAGGGSTVQCTVPCDAQQVCSHDVCVPLVQCTTDDDCENDTYCAADGTCQPWSGHAPPDDPSCVNLITPGVFAPKVKCEFSTAPAGDSFPTYVDVQSTPVVANFNPGGTGVPSIAASFSATVPGGYDEGLGVIRVLRGDDCTLEANLAGVDLDGDGVIDYTVSSSTLAVGDLDGDGLPDIVSYGADGSMLAFTNKNNAWSLLWKAPLPAGAPWGPCVLSGAQTRCPLGWAGPAIHDLDDDGVPEVIREGVVFDGKTGALKAMQPVNPAAYTSYSQGNFSVLANLDGGPDVELTNGQYIWKFTGGAWAQDPTYASPSAPGFVAVADFGAYGTGIPPTDPEIVVVTASTVAVYARDGSVVMPPVAVPGTGGGGPPTIADFDGDGLPEIGVAGADFYTVYDPDCGPNARPGGACSQGPCDFNAVDGTCPPQGYLAWSSQSQDHSSNVTGSSVFDFEADGSSEVVYADECFVRVYNGSTGEVLFSQYHSSCTWYENPIVADTDGNFRADLVTPSNKACAPAGQDAIACGELDANGVDAKFAGLHCKKNSDCFSNVCDTGLCRCTAGAECCDANDDAACLEQGFACVPPPVGTPGGGGNTCRAAHPHGVSGIRVYSDAHDKWVRSRAIWNQHAYAVTNVNDDGTIPKTSQWLANWTQPGLNNFRQNVPGTQNGNATGDLTAGATDSVTCDALGGATLSAPVCNRGADPVAQGLSVGFFVNGASVCEGHTTSTLQPGMCEDVTCTWAAPPTTQAGAVDVTVTPNDQMQYAECKKGNNDGVIQGVFCMPVH
jgi:hypothetical protein